MLACPKPKTSDQVKGLYAFILVHTCVLSMTILDLCQMTIPCPYERIWPYIDDWLTGLILQGCDASKCCPPSFAKNGNGQLPFNRWRLLVVMFNCLTFAHLLQIFLNNIFNQVGWQQQSNEPHWYSSAPFFCVDQLRHAWSTGLSSEEWPPFSGTKLLWPTLSAGSKAKRTWFGTFAGFGWASSGVLLLS